LILSPVQEFEALPEVQSETFAECSILFKFKEGENFNHRNILDISRIKI
jgi:hypothetical protein